MLYGMRDLACNMMGIRQQTTDHRPQTTDLGMHADLQSKTCDQMSDVCGLMSDVSTALPALRRDEFWALQNISFDLRKGESLGVIGMNGSGKSTLLRVLNAVYPPDHGEVRIRGRVGGLIALGAGMHPHLTGRENIYLNGTILGMTHAEIDEKYESITQFAEIGDFLEAPLATYSSGMHVRLGFAVAIHREPDILLVDEVLSVGDYSFVNKSLRYLADYKKKAKAIIYISHNLEQVRNLCAYAIVMDKGCVAYQGQPDQAVSYYQDLCARRRRESLGSSGGIRPSTGGGIESINFKLVSDKRVATQEIGMDEALVFQCIFNVMKSGTRPYFSIGIMDEKGALAIWKVSNDRDGVDLGSLSCGQYRATMTIRDHHLMPGTYSPLFAIRDDDTMETCSPRMSAESFVIRPVMGVLARGMVRADADWGIERI